MKKFDVEITETLQRTVTVEATSQEEAERMVERSWRDGDYMLTDEDYVGVDFKTVGEHELSEKKMQEKIGDVIEVLCEGYDPVAGVQYGRSRADAPDVDGKVYFTAKGGYLGYAPWALPELCRWGPWDAQRRSIHDRARNASMLIPLSPAIAGALPRESLFARPRLHRRTEFTSAAAHCVFAVRDGLR